MNLYLISQDEKHGYDSYDSAVVAADTEDEARMTHPGSKEWDGKEKDYGSWCNAEFVSVKLIGVAADDVQRGVVCASFNAG